MMKTSLVVHVPDDGSVTKCKAKTSCQIAGEYTFGRGRLARVLAETNCGRDSAFWIYVLMCRQKGVSSYNSIEFADSTSTQIVDGGKFFRMQNCGAIHPEYFVRYKSGILYALDFVRRYRKYLCARRVNEKNGIYTRLRKIRAGYRNKLRKTGQFRYVKIAKFDF